MSIVRPTRPTRRDWFLSLIRSWALALFVCGVITGVLRTAAADDPPSEPAEYFIVSDEANSKEAAAENKPTDSADDEVSSDKSEEQPGDEAASTKKSEDESTGEEYSEDEVAPLEEPNSEESASKKETADDELQTTEARPAKEGDSVAGAPSGNGPPAVEQASFEGVLPGTTTVAEMEAVWGPANEIKKVGGRIQQIFDLKPFKQVVATILDKKVDTIVISLEKPAEPAALSRELKISDVEPATIYNSKGQMLGQAYPERGVLFGFAPQSSPIVVAQVVVEPINSQPFVTRAEKNLYKNLTKAAADIEYALKIDPEFDRAHAVHARVLCELGQFKLACKAAEKAVALVDNDIEHRLTHAKMLFNAADYDQAALIAERVTTDETATEIVQAQAHRIWGDTLSKGRNRAFEKAIKHHTEAIRLAEAAARKNYGPVRRAAKELLVDAHLAVAHDIAWGNWQQKNKVVPKWIERANAFCDNLLTREKGNESVRLRAYEQTLAAYAGMKDAPSVASTIDSMNKLGRKLLADEVNESRRHRLQWELGEAMTCAMLILQSQDKADTATLSGEEALAYFKQAGKIGEEWPGHNLALGQVYYRLGAIQAVNGQHHKRAIDWYEKATPLLEAPAPSCLCNAGRQGEVFVSMAVSYWETGKQEEAVRLTFQGVKLIEDAVSHDLLPKTALAVPYGNLSSMHQELGHNVQAKEYSEMASKFEGVRR